MTFEFERLQLSVQLAFSFTINKSQGQSLKCTGLFLDKPGLSHGQLVTIELAPNIGLGI